MRGVLLKTPMPKFYPRPINTRSLVFFLFDFLCDCMCGQAHEPTGAYTLTKYGLQVSHITWELVRNAESQFQVCTNTHLTHWLYWIRICFEIALGDNSCTYQFEKGCSSKASSSHTSKIFPRLEQGSDHPLLSVALLSYISPGHVLQTSWLVVNCLLLAHLLPRL